jgi:hypothetical protein
MPKKIGYNTTFKQKAPSRVTPVQRPVAQSSAMPRRNNKVSQPGMIK